MMAQTTLQPDTLTPSEEGRGSRIEGRLRITLLYAADAGRVGEWIELEPGATRPVPISRVTPIFGTPPRPLADPYLSRAPAWIERRRDGSVALRSESPRLRWCALDGEPVTQLDAAGLTEGQVVTLGPRLILHLGTRPPQPDPPPDGALLGPSTALARVRARIDALAPTDMAVLVAGESGVGKELVARALHARSARASNPLVALNVAAVPPQTAPAAFFGHAKGAFTGAGAARPGAFHDAHGGTLFLDEIGEIDPAVQAQLLRAIETGEIQPVGGRPERVDVRLITASDAALERMVEQGAFRKALFHRVSSVRIDVPPLRTRPDDLAVLAVHFLRAALSLRQDPDPCLRQPQAARPWWSQALVLRLLQADWPGNVRQLRDCMQELAWTCADKPLAELPAHRWSSLATAPTAPARGPAPPRSGPLELDQVRAALDANDHVVGRAAKALGVARNTLYSYLERSPDLRTAKQLSAQECRAALAECGGDVVQAARTLQVSAHGLRMRLKALDAT